MDKNMKLWTNISSLLMNIHEHSSEPRKCISCFCPYFHVFVHNFMFLSTFSRKLYEHLNMFIRIGNVSWHLLNMFLGIFVTILLFFLSLPTKITSKKNKKNQTLLFPISTKINQTLKKILNPTKHSTFIISKP